MALLKTLQWLPSAQRITFKFFVMIYTVLQDLASALHSYTLATVAFFFILEYPKLTPILESLNCTLPKIFFSQLASYSDANSNVTSERPFLTAQFKILYIITTLTYILLELIILKLLVYLFICPPSSKKVRIISG